MPFISFFISAKTLEGRFLLTEIDCCGGCSSIKSKRVILYYILPLEKQENLLTKEYLLQQTQDSETPSSIYKVAALLLYNGLIDLSTLYAHVSNNFYFHFYCYWIFTSIFILTGWFLGIGNYFSPSKHWSSGQNAVRVSVRQ